MFGKKIHAEEPYRKILDAGDEEFHLNHFEQALREYSKVVYEKVGTNDFVLTEALLKRCKTYITQSEALRGTPASKSEREAVFAFDPDTITGLGLKDAVECRQYLESALATVLEITGDGYRQVSQYDEAWQAYRSSLSYRENGKVRDKMKHCEFDERKEQKVKDLSDHVDDCNNGVARYGDFDGGGRISSHICIYISVSVRIYVCIRTC